MILFLEIVLGVVGVTVLLLAALGAFLLCYGWKIRSRLP